MFFYTKFAVLNTLQFEEVAFNANHANAFEKKQRIVVVM